MARILVLYYSSYGHIETMAYAAAEGIREAGAEAVVKRVPELVPEELARKSGYKLDQKAPVATVDEMAATATQRSPRRSSSTACAGRAGIWPTSQRGSLGSNSTPVLPSSVVSVFPL